MSSIWFLISSINFGICVIDLKNKSKLQPYICKCTIEVTVKCV